MKEQHWGMCWVRLLVQCLGLCWGCYLEECWECWWAQCWEQHLDWSLGWHWAILLVAN